MQIDSLVIEGFRCLENTNLSLSPGIQCIVGSNAAGKTSLLEAIHILGRGASFKGSSLQSIIQSGTDAATLRTRFRDEYDHTHQIGCHITRHNQQFKLDDQAGTRRIDLINAIPLQHIDPNVHRLIEQGPKQRRHFLDWGVFHVEQAFFPAWRRYRRALKQRNRALRTKQSKHLVISWDAELVQQGEIIDACRRRYLDLVKERLPESARRLVGNEGVLSFSYNPGWRGNEGYGCALAGGLEQDIRSGFTQQGPHRADMRISVDTNGVRDWISRGQQKLLTAALLISQASILQEIRNVSPILLLDDMGAELGASFRNVLADELMRLGSQCFLTFLEREQVPESFSGLPVFHVEHGRISTL